MVGLVKLFTGMVPDLKLIALMASLKERNLLTPELEKSINAADTLAALREAGTRVSVVTGGGTGSFSVPSTALSPGTR